MKTELDDSGGHAAIGRERVFEVLVLAAALATVPLIILQERGVLHPAVAVADWLIWSIFAAEFTDEMIKSKKKLAALRRALLSLIVVVVSFPLLPALFGLSRLIRLIRLGRLLRLARGFRALSGALGRRGLIYVASFAVLAVFGAGALMATIEPQTVKGGFWSGVWWALVTATTVGYGDISPATVEGRSVAALLMIVGIGLVGTLAASIAAYFVGQQESSELAGIEQRLERIETLLENIRAEAK